MTIEQRCLLTANRRWLLSTIVAVLAVLTFSATATRADIPSRALAAVHEATALRYSGVAHVTTEQLLELQSKHKDKLLLLDVREHNEHRVSHISSSLQVPPDMTAAAFADKFRSILKDKTIVVYCSVGVRSSVLADRIASLQEQLEITAVYNLKGGIFNWHNKRLPLINASSTTDFVHPYSSFWSYLVDRKALISYDPAS